MKKWQFGFGVLISALFIWLALGGLQLDEFAMVRVFIGDDAIQEMRDLRVVQQRDRDTQDMCLLHGSLTKLKDAPTGAARQ